MKFDCVRGDSGLAVLEVKEGDTGGNGLSTDLHSLPCPRHLPRRGSLAPRYTKMSATPRSIAFRPSLRTYVEVPVVFRPHKGHRGCDAEERAARMEGRHDGLLP